VIGYLPGDEVELAKQLRIDLDLPGHELHRGLGYVLPPREPALHLEELQQQAKAQPRRPGLVAHQGELVLIQRPALDEIFQLPLPPHRSAFLPIQVEGRKKHDL
jgi:hypothetical protein